MSTTPTRGHGFAPRYDWGFVVDRIADAPNEWIEAFEVTSGTISNVRTGKVAQLRRFLDENGGSLMAIMRDSHLVTTDVGTSRRGTLLVLWSPNGEANDE